MTEDYIIMERKEQEEHNIIAFPRSKYKKELEKDFDFSGNLYGLTREDFPEQSYFGMNYFNLTASENLVETSDYYKKKVKHKLHELCESMFREDRMIIDKSQVENLMPEIIDNELTHGNIYVLRFIGKNLRKNEAVHKSHAYFFKETYEKLKLDGKNLFLNEQQIDLPEDIARRVEFNKFFEGDLELIKSGKLYLHRKNLKSFESTGSRGSKHSNGPWIALKDW